MKINDKKIEIMLIKIRNQLVQATAHTTCNMPRKALPYLEKTLGNVETMLQIIDFED
ncbi:hypothetical protein [Cetobacterium sp.]|uniref:hypothetical protein n=1 Tax=Cetobacterium sp. TaxID=2071632 RepID=UPI003F676FFA